MRMAGDRPVAELTVAELVEVLAETARPEPEEGLLTISQVAEMLRLTPRTVQRLAASGQIPAGRHVGGSLRWSRRQMREFCDDLAAAAEAERAKLRGETP